jgi:excisionase family DNA binding protein
MKRSGAGSCGMEALNQCDETSIPFAQRLTCSVSDAVEATGISRAKLYQLISDGSVSSTTVGRRRLVHVGSLRSLLLTDDRAV